MNLSKVICIFAILMAGLSQAKNQKKKKPKNRPFKPKKIEMELQANEGDTEKNEEPEETDPPTESPVTKPPLLTTIKPDFENIGNETVKNLKTHLDEIVKRFKGYFPDDNATFTDYTDALLMITDQAIANETKLDNTELEIKKLKGSIENPVDEATEQDINKWKGELERDERTAKELRQSLDPIRTMLNEIGFNDSVKLPQIKAKLPDFRFKAMIYQSASKNLDYVKKCLGKDSDENEIETLMKEQIPRAMKWYNVYVNYLNDEPLMKELMKDIKESNKNESKKLEELEELMGNQTEYLKTMMALGFEYTLEGESGKDDQIKELKEKIQQDSEMIDNLEKQVVEKDAVLEYYEQTFNSTEDKLKLEIKDLKKKKADFSAERDQAKKDRDTAEENLKDETKDKEYWKKEFDKQDAKMKEMDEKMAEKDKEIGEKDQQLQDLSGSTSLDKNCFLILNFAFLSIFHVKFSFL